MHKVEREFSSRDTIWKGVSQLRNGLRKSPSSTKSFPRCRNDLQASKMGCDLLFYVSFFLLATKWLQNDLQASKWLRKCSKHQNELRTSYLAAKWFRSPIATPWEILHLLRKWPFDCEMIFQTSKWLWNDLQNVKMGCENVSIFSMGCENVFLFSLWLQDDLQSYEMTSKL